MQVISTTVAYLALSCIVTQALGCCPGGWTNVGQSCFKVSPGPLNWFDSSQYCYMEGGHLIEIRDQAKQDLLPTFLPNTNDKFYWIGLTDLMQEGTFGWENDSGASNYTNWMEGEPNDWRGEEDCAFLFVDFEWNDRDCNVSHQHYPPGLRRNIHALCEKTC